MEMIDRLQPFRRDSARLHSVAIIVPTFREVENVPELVQRLQSVRAMGGLQLDLLLVDDDSGDGIAGVVEALGLDWVRVIVRHGERGLSTAVLHGLETVHADTLVVMDADLSHPPEVIPQLLAKLDDGADFALGSRYMDGGATDAKWSMWRRLNSGVATLLARPFAAVSDPMSGFFALRRSTILRAASLNPLGYKIGLELIVKCRCRDVREVPIGFRERTRGRSKLTLRQQWLYLRHLWRLWRFRLSDRRRNVVQEEGLRHATPLVKPAKCADKCSE